MVCRAAGRVRVCRPHVELRSALAGRPALIVYAEQAAHELQRAPILVERHDLGCRIAERRGLAGDDYVFGIDGVDRCRSSVEHVAIDVG